MSFKGDDFTEKASEALSGARDVAREFKNINVFPPHLALGLLNAEDGLAKKIISLAKGDATAIERALKRLIVKLPAQDPAPDEPGFSQELVKVLKGAQEQQKKNGDSFIAVDHFILALMDHKDVREAFQSGGAVCSFRHFVVFSHPNEWVCVDEGSD